MSQDDLALLKQMYQRGEIDDEQYDVLRRHVLWGTPLPDLVDDPPPALPSGTFRGPPVPPETRPRHVRDTTSPGPRPWSASPATPSPHPRPSPAPAPRSSSPSSAPSPAVQPGRSGPPWAPAPAVGQDQWGRDQWGPPSGPLPPWPDNLSESVRSGWTVAASPSSAAQAPPAAAGAGAGRPTRAAPPAPSRPPRGARRGPRLIAVLASLLLAVALAGVGVWWFALRATGVEPAAYARSVCSSVGGWQRELNTRSGTLRQEIERQPSPADRRAAAVDYYTVLAVRTSALETALRAAGAPDLPGGKVYADTLVNAVSTQVSSLRDSAGRAGRLDVSRPKEFGYSLNSLLASDGSLPAEVTTILAHPPIGTSPELRAALAAEPTCAPYTG
jgi:hypothetical protein